MIDYSYDLERLEQDLQTDSSRLFVDDTESYIQVIASDGTGKGPLSLVKKILSNE